jgi:CHAD domain-containing protein
MWVVGYVFTSPQHLAFEIRRVATERLDHALEQLSGEALSLDPVAAVHTARKDIKKTRSLMRLARGSLDPAVYRAENDRLRSAAHELADVREADALAASLESLISMDSQRMSNECAAEAGQWLSRIRLGGHEARDVSTAAARASAILLGARDNARLWALGYGSFDLIGAGVGHTYRQGRRGLGKATRDPSDETVHEWRKRVKDMWYSLRLFGEVWEPVIRPLADQTHDLSELLGGHHDLGELRLAAESGQSGLSPEAGAELARHAEARQAQLHGAALSLGKRLYAESPRRYVSRLEGLWRVWEADVERHVAQEGLPGS